MQIADNGKIIKAVRTENQPVVIEEIQVFSVTVPVTNLMIHRGTDRQPGQARLIVSSQSEVVALKLQRCYSDKVTSCGECVKLRDPYCAWDKRKQKCVAVGSWTLGANLFQNVATGVHDSCPDSLSQGNVNQFITSGRAGHTWPPRGPHRAALPHYPCGPYVRPLG